MEILFLIYYSNLISTLHTGNIVDEMTIKKIRLDIAFFLIDYEEKLLFLLVLELVQKVD